MKAPVKRKKSTSTKGHYVTNATLLPAVLRAKEAGKVTDELIGMIQQIATRYSLKHNFIGYSFREDMVAEAVRNLCVNALKFNPDRQAVPNPFSYYTSAINNSFLQYMNDEKKQRDIRDALLMDAGSNPSFNFLEREKDEGDFEIKDSDNPIHVVDDPDRPRKPGEPEWEDFHPERQPSEAKIISDLVVNPITGEIVRTSTGKVITKDDVIARRTKEVAEKEVKKRNNKGEKLTVELLLAQWLEAFANGEVLPQLDSPVAVPKKEEPELTPEEVLEEAVA